MSPISGTHLRLPCFGFSLTNTIFERATVYRQAAFPSKVLESQADVDAYVERMRAYLNAMLKDCDGIKLN